MFLPDLNLIRTFLLLYETGSVTQTASRLSITQSATSRSLGRLRTHLNDQLFVRSSEGMRPTQRAISIYPLWRQALTVIDEAVDQETGFDPAISTHKFRLRATDLGEISLVPPVLRQLMQASPAVGLEIIRLNMETAEDELRQGKADLVICTPRLAAPDIVRDLLFVDHYCGIRAVGHPRIGARPTLDQFLEERHIAVEDAAGHMDIDRSLTQIGKARTIAMHITHFAALPQLVECSDLLAIIPSSVAQTLSMSGEIETFALPYGIPALEVSAYTYRRRLPDAGTEWFRQVVSNTLRNWNFTEYGGK